MRYFTKAERTFRKDYQRFQDKEQPCKKVLMPAIVNSDILIQKKYLFNLCNIKWWNHLYNTMLTRLTNRLSNQLYNFTRKPSTNSSFVNLYQSSIFKSIYTIIKARISTISLMTVKHLSDISNYCPLSSSVYHIK